MADPEPASVVGAAPARPEAPTPAPSSNDAVASSVAAGNAKVVTEDSAESIADPAAAPATANASTIAPAKVASCGNCGVPLQGKYCHECGQKDYDFRKSFRSVIGELLETFLNFDAKLLRGMYALLFQPGKLTVDFLAGKRTSQVPPLRFYIFLSIVSFVWSGAGDRPNIQVAEKLDQELALKPALQTKEAQQTAVMQILQRGAGRQEEINEMFREYLPQMFLLCVPLLAVLLAVAFRRVRHTYLQHLVAAVHLQTFALLLGVTATGWGRIFGLFWRNGYQGMRLIALLYFFGYGFVALRRIYGESSGATLAKGLAVLFAYWCALMVTMAGVVIVAFLLL